MRNLWLAETATSLARIAVAPDRTLMRVFTLGMYALIAYSFRRELEVALRMLHLGVSTYPLTFAAVAMTIVSMQMRDARHILIVELAVLWLRCLQNPSPSSTSRDTLDACTRASRAAISDVLLRVSSSTTTDCAGVFFSESTMDLRTWRVAATVAMTVFVSLTFDGSTPSYRRIFS